MGARLIGLTLLAAASLSGVSIVHSAPAGGDALDAVLSGDHRSAENAARDVYRHPRETLEFFGLQKGMRVIEILPGRGWYTEILAPALRSAGQLVVATPGGDHPNDFLGGLHDKLIEKMASDPDVYDRVEVKKLQTATASIDLGPPDSADMVLTFRSTHNWIRFGGIEQAYRAFFEVLKPGGVLGVVQHRGKDSWVPEFSAQNGYVPQAYLIGFIEQIGFEFVDSAEINANPKDSKNYPEGVWSLPPSYRLGDKDREKYTAIGESDRMTLKFVKPSS
jgi:predicted methyltransferase